MFLHDASKLGPTTVGTGVDLVAIKRFEPWVRSVHRLCKIFTQAEIVRYLHEFESVQDDFETPHIIKRKASYWAVRFAAKEAFLKALSSTLAVLAKTDQPLTLLFVCQHTEIIKDKNNIPSLRIHWATFEKKLKIKLPKFRTHLSLTHEQNYAFASVIVSL